MEHGKLIGVASRDSVDDVKAKVEFVCVFEANGRRSAFFVLLDIHKVVPDAVAVVDGLLDFFFLDDLCLGELGDRLACRVKNDRVEDAVASAHCYHAVGRAAVVVDAVAGAQDLAVLADLHLEASVDDDIDLLPVVLGQVDGTVLRGFVIHTAHVKGLCDPVLERVCQVVVGHAVCAGYLLSVARTCQRVGAKVGAVALEDIRHGYFKCVGAPVDECEVQVPKARFAFQIFFDRDIGHLCHVLGSEIFQFSQNPDSSGDLLNFVIQFLYHFFPAFRIDIIVTVPRTLRNEKAV